MLKSIKAALAMVPLAFSASTQPHAVEQLVHRFSARWTDLQAELDGLATAMHLLPDIPIENFGGTGGLISFVSGSNTHDDWPLLTIEARWGEEAAIDMVALVPARRYDARGLHPEFGLPNRFEIDLMDAEGNPVSRVAEECAARARPVQRGFPFVYTLPKPVLAHGIRIRCREPQQERFEAASIRTVALAELFCFSGMRNLAEGAAVKLHDDATTENDWHWMPEFLVDGLTPLGLPEVPAPGLRHIGWLSRPRKTEELSAYVEIDLGRPEPIDGVRIFPARRKTIESPPGFAMPRRFLVLAANTGELHAIYEQMKEDLLDPGMNPITVRFPKTIARRVRIACPKVWRAYPNYPAFLAFSEIQLLYGETNLAKGAVVTSSDMIGETKAHGGLAWSEQALVNGYGPQGRLVPRREWLQLLDQRLGLETRQHLLRQEAAALVARWKRKLFGTLGGIGGLAVLATMVLPIRYRFREQRRLQQVREQIAADLHDEVGANLSSIANSAELLAEIPGQQTPKQRELMEAITATARNTAVETRMLIHFLEHKGVEGNVVGQFLIAANQMLSGIPFTQRFDDVAAFNQLSPILKWDLLLFFKEALQNIVKHAGASFVELEASASRHRLVLTIRDDGIGLANGQIPAHLASRAKKLRGDLRISARPGGGTEIQLNLPRKRMPLWKKPSRS